MDHNYMKLYHRNDYEEKSIKDKGLTTNTEPLTTQIRRERQIMPYTFDPKPYMESSSENPNHNATKPLSKDHKTPPKITQFGSEFSEKGDVVLDQSKVPQKSSTKIEVKAKDESNQVKNWLVLNLIEDLSGVIDIEEIKQTLTNDKQETEILSKQIGIRTEKLKSFSKELESSDPNMILFKNKLIRELGEIQNDLKEADSNILLLMKERINMKEQLLLLSVTNNKHKDFIKVILEDTKVYFLFNIIVVASNTVRCRQIMKS